MSTKTCSWLAMLGLLGVVCLQGAEANDSPFPVVGISTGVNVTSGRYGGDIEIEDTEVPVALSVDYERVAFTVKVPYLSVSTTGPGQTTSESGLGDVSAGVTFFDVVSNRDLGLALDVTAAMKFATADADQGLGTGENDVSLYVDGYKFFESVTLLGSVGRRWRGSPVGAPLNDVFLATIGATIWAGDDALLGITFDYRESAIPDTDDIQELRGFASFSLSDNWVIECHSFTGFTDSSPDWGGGIAIATRLRRFGFRTVD